MIILIVKIVVLLIGLSFSIIGYLQRNHFSTYTKATAIVVKREKTYQISISNMVNGKSIQVEKETDPDEYATFQFDVNNKQYEVRSRMKITPGYTPGSEVSILYDPDNPNKAVINHIFYKGIFFLLPGIFTTIISVLLFLFM